MIANQELALFAARYPHHAPGIFFYGTLDAEVPFDNGTQCVGGNSKRLSVSVCDEDCFASKPFDVPPSETRDFQFYEHDTRAGEAPANSSAGLRVGSARKISRPRAPR